MQPCGTLFLVLEKRTISHQKKKLPFFGYGSVIKTHPLQHTNSPRMIKKGRRSPHPQTKKANKGTKRKTEKVQRLPKGLVGSKKTKKQRKLRNEDRQKNAGLGRGRGGRTATPKKTFFWDRTYQKTKANAIKKNEIRKKRGKCDMGQIWSTQKDGGGKLCM